MKPTIAPQQKRTLFWCKQHVLIKITWSNRTVKPIITRITIDCLELFIQKRKISSNQTITLCSYKHWIRNAAKLLVWITPNDVISFIPPLVTSALHKITAKMGYLKSTQHYSNEETTLRHTFLCIDLHCLLLLPTPESFSQISLPITGKSFILTIMLNLIQSIAKYEISTIFWFVLSFKWPRH